MGQGLVTLYVVCELLGYFLLLFPIRQLSSPFWCSSGNKMFLPRSFSSRGWILPSLFLDSQHESLLHPQASALSVPWFSGSGAVCAWWTWDSPTAIRGLQEHSTRKLVTARQRYHTTCMIPHTEWSIYVVVTVFSTDLYHNNTYHLSFVSFRHKPSGDLRKRIQLCTHIYPWSMNGPPVLLNKCYLDKLNFSMKARSDLSTPWGTNPRLEHFHIWI